MVFNFIKKNKLFLVLIGIFVLAKLFFLQRFHMLIWDEAAYLSMGKYLFSFGKVGLWEIFRPPIVPFLTGISSVLGIDRVFFGELLVIGFSTGVIIFTYLVAKNVFNRKVGLLASFFMAITPVFFLYSSYILTGIPSLFFVLVSLYFLTRSKPIGKMNYIFSGAFAGIAFLTRFPNGLFFASLMLFFGFVFLLKRTRKNFYPILYLLLSFIAVQIPFLIYNFFMYKDVTGKLYHALFRPWIYAWSHQYNPAEIIGQKFFYFIQLSQQNFWLVFAIAGLIFYFSAKKYKNKIATLLLTTLLLYLVYFNWMPNKQSRFIISFLPYLCIFAAYGIYKLMEGISREKKYGLVKFIIPGIVILLSLILIIPADTDYYSWRHETPPLIVDEFYEYFKESTSMDRPLKILTADPVPSAYVDAQFVPIYFSLNTAYHEYENFDYEYIIYATDTYYCLPEDAKCKSEVEDFVKMISSENDLVFTKKYKTRTYYIYKKPADSF